MFECITSRGRVSLSPEYRVSFNLKPFKIAPIRTAHKATSKSHCTRTNLLLEATARKLQIAPICTAHKVTSNSRTHCIRAQIAPVHTAHKATSEPNGAAASKPHQATHKLQDQCRRADSKSHVHPVRTRIGNWQESKCTWPRQQLPLPRALVARFTQQCLLLTLVWSWSWVTSARGENQRFEIPSKCFLLLGGSSSAASWQCHL